MSHRHSPGFLALIDAAKRNVKEITIEEFRGRLEAGDAMLLVDVREDHEWDRGRLPGAVHIGKGVIERDIEKQVPDAATPIVLQCGGGYRSLLVGENLQRMGYTNVWSLAEGYRGWLSRGLPIEPGDGG